MEQSLQPIWTQVRQMWGRRWIGLGVAWAIALIAAPLVLLIPERHEATARVYVDTQTMIKPLLQGLTVQPDIDQMVGMLARTLITRPNIEQLIVNGGLDAGAGPQARGKLVDDLMKGIRVTPSSGKNLYDVAYRDTDPDRARRVVEQLVALFVNAGAGNKRRDTEDARKFIDEQIAIYEQKLAEAENRLKEFKLRNINVIGAVGAGAAAGQDYFTRIATLQQDLAALRIDLDSAEQSRDAIRRQLNGELAERANSQAAAALQTPELDARIDAQRKALDELLRRYTDEHPDVVATRRLIAQLEQERDREIERRRNQGALAAGDEKADQALQQLKVKLADADASVASLRGKYAGLSARLQELRSAANRIPQAEAELAQLNRDYDVIKKNYEQLAQRRESASISGNADADARLAEFRVVEPPRVSPLPVFPSRMVLELLALLAALSAGIGASFAIAQLMPTVQNARDLRAISTRPVLYSVSLLPDPASRARARHVQFALATTALIAAYGCWLALTWLSHR